MNKKELAVAKAEHNKFLKRMGALPEQIKSRKPKRQKLRLPFTGTADTYFDKKPLSDVLQGDSDTATKRDIITNIYKQDPQTQKIIKQKASQVAILVNKGGYGVITPGMDPKTFGRK
jgi:hypothetical protein